MDSFVSTENPSPEMKFRSDRPCQSWTERQDMVRGQKRDSQGSHGRFWKEHLKQMIIVGTTFLWVQGFTKRPLQSPQLKVMPVAFN